MTLADCMMPLFAQVRVFAQAPSGDAQSLSARLDSAIARARGQCESEGYTQGDFNSALFAFSAWADELLLAARWDDAAQWQRCLLQRRYFNLGNAGVAFYDALAQLAPEQLAVREIYYLSLALGFGGRYAYDRNQKALTDIKRENLLMLLPAGGKLPAGAQALLFPEGYDSATVAARTPLRARFSARRSRSLLLAILLPLLLLLLLFGIYHYLAGQSVDALAGQIHP